MYRVILKLGRPSSGIKNQIIIRGRLFLHLPLDCEIWIPPVLSGLKIVRISQRKLKRETYSVASVEEKGHLFEGLCELLLGQLQSLLQGADLKYES